LASPRTKIAQIITYLERFQKDAQLARQAADIIDWTHFLEYVSCVEDWEKNHPKEMRRLLAALMQRAEVSQDELTQRLDRLVEEAAGQRPSKRVSKGRRACRP
jgi:hypothetical protein